VILEYRVFKAPQVFKAQPARRAAEGLLVGSVRRALRVILDLKERLVFKALRESQERLVLLDLVVVPDLLVRRALMALRGHKEPLEYRVLRV
jgi:hypothetical protein